MKRLGLFFVAVIFLVGCNKNIPLGGKVTFSDDGSPLTTGTVFFETDTFQVRGQLNEKGIYRLGTFKTDDGIPPGEYRIYISGAVEQSGTDRTGTPVYIPLIDPKYVQSETSGLRVDVTPSRRTFDFQVDRPRNKQASF